MIVTWFLHVVGSVLASGLDLLPSWDAPSWLTPQGGPLSGMLSAAGSMGVWVPMNLAVTVALAVVGSIGVGLAIRIFRMALSLFTGGGGS